MNSNLESSAPASSRSHADDCSGRVVFILPQLPPVHCGLGDYSMILLGHMKLDPPPRILVMNGAAETRAIHPHLDVESLPGSCEGLLQRLRELKASRVFVQYVAQGFQSRGCPLWLLAALRKWKVDTPTARLVIMFQELWFEPAWWKPDWLLQKFHRVALRKLVGVTDQTFVSTETFGKWLVGATAPDRVRVLINPATIPLAGSVADARREQGCFVLFGRQGSRIFALQDMAPWLALLHAKGMLKKLLIVGSRENESMNNREDSLAAASLPAKVAEVIGPLPSQTLSYIFQTAQIGVCGKTSKFYTKSTIFMSYSLHGLPILSPNKQLDDQAPLKWVLHPEQILDGSVNDQEITLRGNKLADWYNSNVSWDRVAETYCRALSLYK